MQLTFSKSDTNSPRKFKIFDHSPFLPKVQSIAECYRQKYGVKFSIVFVTVFWAFLVKKRSQTSRFRQKRGVKLIVVDQKTRSKTVRFRQYTAYSEKKWNCSFLPNMWSETKRFRRKHRVKQCVFGDNAVFAKILLCTEILHLILINCWNSGPRPCLLLNDAKNGKNQLQNLVHVYL